MDPATLCHRLLLPTYYPSPQAPTLHHAQFCQQTINMKHPGHIIICVHITCPSSQTLQVHHAHAQPKYHHPQPLPGNYTNQAHDPLTNTHALCHTSPPPFNGSGVLNIGWPPGPPKLLMGPSVNPANTSRKHPPLSGKPLQAPRAKKEQRRPHQPHLQGWTGKGPPPRCYSPGPPLHHPLP
jgi:hypothetical protein